MSVIAVSENEDDLDGSGHRGRKCSLHRNNHEALHYVLRLVELAGLACEDEDKRRTDSDIG